MCEQLTAELECLFETISAKIDDARKAYMCQYDEIERCLETYFDDSAVERISNEMNAYRNELIAEARGSLEKALLGLHHHHGKNTEFKRGHMSLYGYFMSRLNQLNAFSSIEKIKYVNLLRVLEYDET